VATEKSISIHILHQVLYMLHSGD